MYIVTNALGSMQKLHHEFRLPMPDIDKKVPRWW